MGTEKHGRNEITFRRTERGWYIMIGTIAICSHNAPVHLHSNMDPAHPEHVPKIPLNPLLTFETTLARAQALWRALDRQPTAEELVEALA